MDRSGWERMLTYFQASSRGYLVRNKIRRAREDFEEIVKELDGDLTHLRWSEAIVPTPHFADGEGTLLQPSNYASKSRKAGPDVSLQSPSVMTRSTREKHHGGPARKTEAERNDSQTKDQASLADSREYGRGQTKSVVVDKDGEKMENTGDSTSAWSSLELDMNHGNSDKGPCQYFLAQEVPCTPEALRLHRNTLTMELLWLQQAIDSRKKYISLKNQLNVS
ncbi:IQ domain-containing protein C [Antennarius striatus]|uniref:IQ domain-containing protein C n=1 Tax=Antennarius striatus TaxID=241820 RepID=UPI0035B19A49